MKRIDDVWDPCPEGELVRLGAAIRRADRLRLAGYLTITLALAMLGFTIVTLAATSLGR